MFAIIYQTWVLGFELENVHFELLKVEPNGQLGNFKYESILNRKAI